MPLTIGLGPVSAGGGGGANGGQQGQSIFDLEFVTTTASLTVTDTSLTEFPICDTSMVTSIYNGFKGCTKLAVVPQLDFSNITNAGYAFYECRSLKKMPVLDMGKCTSVARMFYGCYNLESIEGLNLASATDMNYMFYDCRVLKSLPYLNSGKATNMSSMFMSCGNLESVQIDSTSATNIENMFQSCTALKNVQLDISNVSKVNTNTFYGCANLEVCNLKGAKVSINFRQSPLLSKESVLYLFENAQTVSSAQTITLHADVFNQLTEDEIAIATEKGFSVVSA